jgi:hypothetical protein
MAKSEKAPAVVDNEKLKTKKPAFEGSSRLMEFHQVPESENMSGLRLVFDMPDRGLKIGDDSKTTKRIRYGLLVVDYAPDADHMAKIELKGKVDRVATFPESEKEAGYWKITFRPADCDQDDAVKLLKIRNGETPIGLAFYGNYDQKQIFPDKPEPEPID